MSAPKQDLDALDSIIERLLGVARIPGAAVTVIQNGRRIFSRGYGFRDISAKLAATADTVYPIASTTKAINATLLGMLVDEGKLSWDARVQEYLPEFRFDDRVASDFATLHDLVVMRTGLPRHDFLWMGHPISRADMTQALAHLPFAAGFREKFQYNNLTSTLAGHIAEVVTGRSWEDLVRHRLLAPLGMDRTGFAMPSEGDVTKSYHESRSRELVTTRRLETGTIAPAGGCIHSTVNDMSRWVAFNLNGGQAAGRQLIEPRTLKHLHSPHVVMGNDSTAPSPHAAYGLGWYIDTYNGRPRVSHTGNLHSVNSGVMLFPSEGIGVVSFINFGAPRLAQFINQQVFDHLMDLESMQTAEEMLSRYESAVVERCSRNSSMSRIGGTVPTHSPNAYTGSYVHAGYGCIEIGLQDGALVFKRNLLVLPLEHWERDTWVIADNDLFDIDRAHPWERGNQIVFEHGQDGWITAFSMPVEPAVPPARFERDKSVVSNEE